jgi:hypothetical protein
MSSAQENDRRLWPLMTRSLHKLRMPRTDNEASTPGSAITQLASYQLACEGTKNVTRVSRGMLFLISNLAAAGIFLPPTRECVSEYPGLGMFPSLLRPANRLWWWARSLFEVYNVYLPVHQGQGKRQVVG